MEDRFDSVPDTAWHRDMRTSLALFALGALPNAERSMVRHHLAGCAACQVRSLEFAQVAGALSRVTREAGAPWSRSSALPRPAAPASRRRAAGCVFRAPPWPARAPCWRSCP